MLACHPYASMNALPSVSFLRFGIVLLGTVCWACCTAVKAGDFEITATMEENSYTVNGVGWDPPLTLIRGKTYTFKVEACDCHPVIIVGAPLDAVDNNNTHSGTITFRVPMAAANYAYRCSIHHFGGVIQTIDPPPPVIRLTGPRLLRAAAHTAIANILSPGFAFAYTGASPATADQAIFTGTTRAPVSAPVMIKTHWGGTMAGLQSLTQNTPLANAWLAANTPQSIAGTSNAPANYEAAAAADIALTECFQSLTPFSRPLMVDRVVGVVPWQWVRNHGSPAALDNMTVPQAANLLSGGALLSQFTGVPGDSQTLVFCPGLDENSGARQAAFAGSLFGIFSNPTQYRVNLAGSPATVQSIEVWPATTVLGVSYPAGHSGEPDGAALAAKLSAPGSLLTVPNQGWLVSYVHINDAADISQGAPAAASAALSGTSVGSVILTNGGGGYGGSTTVNFTGGGGSGAAGRPVITNGVITGVVLTSGGAGYTSAPAVSFSSGAAMKWSGVPYSPAAVREGQYTFWSYQHLYYRPGFAFAAVADQLAARIKAVEAELTGIRLNTMNTGRVVDGGDIIPENPYP